MFHWMARGTTFSPFLPLSFLSLLPPPPPPPQIPFFPCLSSSSRSFFRAFLPPSRSHYGGVVAPPPLVCVSQQNRIVLSVCVPHVVGRRGLCSPVPLACTAASEGLIDRRRARGCSLRTAVITSRNSRIRRELSHTRSKHLAHQLGQAVLLVHYHNQHLKIPVGLKFSSLFNTRTASLVLL